MSGVIIDVNARASQAEASLDKLENNLKKILERSKEVRKSLEAKTSYDKSAEFKKTADSLRDVERASDAANKSIKSGQDDLSRTLGSVKSAALNLAASFAAFKTTSFFTNAGDDLLNIQNRLKIVTKNYSELISKQEKLFEISQKTNSSLASNASLFVDFTEALQGRQVAESRIFTSISAIQKSALLSGTSLESSKAAIVQLSQGIASGTLRGEELNSVLEQMKFLGTGLQKELGLNAGQLRKFAEEGRLTTDILVNVLEKVDARANKVLSDRVPTVTSSLERLKNTFSFILGDLNLLIGSSARLATNIDKLNTFVLNFGRNSAEAISSFSGYTESLKRQYTDVLDLENKLSSTRENNSEESSNSFQKSLNRTLGALLLSNSKEFGVSLTFDEANTLLKLNDQLNSVKSFLKNVQLDFKIDVGPSIEGFDFRNADLTAQTEVIRTETRKTLEGIAVESKRFFQNLLADAYKQIPQGLLLPATPFLTNLALLPKKILVDENQEIVKSLVPVRQELELIQARLKLFQGNDPRFGIRFAQLFQATSLEDFRQKLSELNSTSSNVSNGFERIGGEVKRFLRPLTIGVLQAGKAIGVFPNTLDLFDTRLDIVKSSLNTLGNVFSQFARSVFLPFAKPLAIRIQLNLIEVRDTITDFLSDVFNFGYGETVGVAIGSLLKSLFSGQTLKSISGFTKEIGEGVVAAFDSVGIALASLIDFSKGFAKGFSGSFSTSLKEAAKDFYRTSIKAFKSSAEVLVKGLDALFQNFNIDFDASNVLKTFDKIEDYAKTRFDSVLRIISEFSKSVKDYFFDVYDKVVGNSYWPDMIDEVNEYTSNIFKSENEIDKFARNVKDIFKKITENIDLSPENVAGKINTFFEKLSSLNFSEAIVRFAGSFSSALIASFLLGFEKAPNILKIASAASLIAVFANVFQDVGTYIVDAGAAKIGDAFADLLSSLILNTGTIVDSLVIGTSSLVSGFIDGIGLGIINSIPLLGNQIFQSLVGAYAVARLLFADSPITKQFSDFLFGSSKDKKLRPSVEIQQDLKDSNNKKTARKLQKELEDSIRAEKGFKGLFAEIGGLLNQGFNFALEAAGFQDIFNRAVSKIRPNVNFKFLGFAFASGLITAFADTVPLIGGALITAILGLSAFLPPDKVRQVITSVGGLLLNTSVELTKKYSVLLFESGKDILKSSESLLTSIKTFFTATFSSVLSFLRNYRGLVAASLIAIFALFSTSSFAADTSFAGITKGAASAEGELANISSLLIGIVGSFAAITAGVVTLTAAIKTISKAKSVFDSTFKARTSEKIFEESSRIRDTFKPGFEVNEKLFKSGKISKEAFDSNLNSLNKEIDKKVGEASAKIKSQEVGFAFGQAFKSVTADISNYFESVKRFTLSTATSIASQIRAGTLGSSIFNFLTLDVFKLSDDAKQRLGKLGESFGKFNDAVYSKSNRTSAGLRLLFDFVPAISSAAFSLSKNLLGIEEKTGIRKVINKETFTEAIAGIKSFTELSIKSFKTIFDAAASSIGGVLGLFGRFLSKPAVIAGSFVAIAGSLSGLSALGEDTFVGNLQRLLDILRSLIGLEATTAPGKRADISGRLQGLKFSGNKISFANEIASVDFSKLSGSLEKALKATVDKTSQRISEIDTTVEQQGFVTKNQITEVKQLEAELRNLFKRLPKNEASQFGATLANVQKDFLIVDNTFDTVSKNILRSIEKSIAEPTGAEDFSFAGAIGATIATAFAALTASLVGAALGLPAIIGAIAGAALYLTGVFDSVVDSVSDGFEVVGESFSDFAKGFSTFIKPFKVEFQNFVEDARLFFENLFDKFSFRVPQQEAEALEGLRNRFSEFFSNAQFLDSDAQQAIKTAENEYAAALQGRTDLERRLAKAIPNSREALRLTTRLGKARQEESIALRQLEFVQARFEAEARDKKDIESVKTRFEKLGNIAKSAFDIDLGNFSVKFLGDEKAVEDFIKYGERLAEIDLEITSAKTAQERIRLNAQREATRQLGLALFESTKVQRDYVESVKSLAKELTFATEESLRFTAFDPLTNEQISKVKNDIAVSREKLRSLVVDPNASQENIEKERNNLDELTISLRRLNPQLVELTSLNSVMKTLKLPDLSIGELKLFDSKLINDIEDLARLSSKAREGFTLQQSIALDLDIERSKANISEKIKNIRLTSSSRDTLRNLGVNLTPQTDILGTSNQILELSKRKSSIESRLNTLTEIEGLSSSNTQVISLRKSLADLEIQISAVSSKSLLNFDQVISKFNELTDKSFTKPEFNDLFKNNLSQIRNVISQIEDADIQLKTQSEISGKEDINTQNKRLSLVKQLNEIVQNKLSKSPTFLQSIFSEFGITATAALENVTSQLDDFSNQAIALSNIRTQLSSKNLALSPKELVAKLIEADKLSKKLSKDAANLDTSLGANSQRISEAFNLNLDKLDFLSLGSIAQPLNQLAMKVTDALEKGLRGSTVTDALVSSVELALKVSKYISFFVDIKKLFREAVTDGVKTGFDKLKSIIPNSPVEFNEFLNIGGAERRRLTSEGARISALQRAADMPNLSQGVADAIEQLVNSGDSTSLDTLYKTFEETFKKEFGFNITDSIEQQQLSVAQDQLNVLKDIKTAVSGSSGSAVSRSAVSNVANTTVSDKVAELSSKTLRDIYITKPAELARETLQKAVSATSNVTTLGGIDLLARANQVQIDPKSLNLLTSDKINLIRTYLDELSQASLKLQEARLAGQATADLAQEIVNLEAKIRKTADATRGAGLALASGLVDDFKSSFKELIKGKISIKDFAKKGLDGITNRILDTFVEGLFSNIGESSNIFAEITKIGGSIFDIGSKGFEKASGFFSLKNGEGKADSSEIIDVGSKTLDFFKSNFPNLTEGVSNIGGTLQSIITVIIQGITSLVSAIFTSNSSDAVSGLASFIPGFATGGMISGAGTGTSDSILTALSNGEYVVNAKSTKRFLPLLQALNAGEIPKFASGGLVGPSYSKISSTNVSSSNNQVININVTGDISRQTKSEIYAMLPNIAEGINLHNREKGYK